MDTEIIAEENKSLILEEDNVQLEPLNPDNLITDTPISLYQAMRLLLKDAVAYSFADLIDVSGGYVGALYLSHYGTEMLAANALANSLQTPLVGFGIGALFASGLRLGELLGSQDDHVGRALNQSYLFALLLALPCSLILLLSPYLYHLLGQSEDLVSLARNYTNIYAGALPFVLLFICHQQFSIALSKPKYLILISSLFTLLNVSLGYGLVMSGKQLGIEGWSLANLFSAAIVSASFAGYFLYSDSFRQFNMRSLSPFWDDLKKLIKKGLPIGLQLFSELISYPIMTLMVGAHGVKSLAASQIAMQYLLLTSIPLISISQTLGIFIKKSLQKNDLSSIKKYLRAGSLISVSTSALVFIATLTLSAYLISPFCHDKNDHQLISTTTHLLWINIGIHFLDGLKNVFSGFLRGFDKNTFSFLTSLCCIGGIGLSSSYVLGNFFDLNVEGIYLGRAAGVLLAAIGTGIKCYSVFQEKKCQSLEKNNIPSKLFSCNLFGFFNKKKLPELTEEKQALIIHRP